jgi:predicted DNA-binding transcriptional regulator YafY
MARSDIRTRRARGDRPSEALARIVWVLVTLLCDEVLDFGACLERFQISERELQRYLKKLRTIGETCGFAISKSINGRVHLVQTGRRTKHLSAKTRESFDTLVRIAHALGGPIEYSLLAATDGHIVPPDGDLDAFLHVRQAQPIDGAAIQPAFEFLRKAAASRAQVEFSYSGPRSPRAIRRVDPYHVVARDGRAYLVAYDCVKRAWRQFALDAIETPLRKVGTYTVRPVPREYVENAVGWIRSGPSIDVTIRFSPVVTPAVLARRWNGSQYVRKLPGGGVELTLTFGDLGEAVRFALQFGAEAAIVDPPRAVQAALETAQRIAALYADTRASAGRSTMSA